jgi:hypothetical protein
MCTGMDIIFNRFDIIWLFYNVFNILFDEQRYLVEK